MMTKLMYLAYRIYFGFNRKFKSLPYEWDPKKIELVYSQDKATIMIWKIMAIAVFIADSYIGLRMVFELFYPVKSFTIRIIVIYMLGFLGFSLCTVFNITIFLRENEMGVMTTTGINMDLRFRKKFKWMRKVRPPLFDYIGFGMLWIVPALFFIALVGSTFCLFAKTGPVRHILQEWSVLLSLLSIDMNLDTLGVKLIVLPIAYLLICALVNIVMFYCLIGITYIQMAIFWTRHLADYCPNYLNKVRKDPKLSPVEKVTEEKKILDAVRSSWTQLQMHCDIINQHCFLVSPGFFTVALLAGLVANYSTLALYSVVPMPYYLMFPTVMWGLIGLDIAFIPQGAKLHIISQEFIGNWKHFGADKYIRRWIPSCRPVCISIGQFFFIARSTTFSYFSILFDYTIDLLLTFQLN